MLVSPVKKAPVNETVAKLNQLQKKRQTTPKMEPTMDPMRGSEGGSRRDRGGGKKCNKKTRKKIT